MHEAFTNMRRDAASLVPPLQVSVQSLGFVDDRVVASTHALRARARKNFAGLVSEMNSPRYRVFLDVTRGFQGSGMHSSETVSSLPFSAKQTALKVT